MSLDHKFRRRSARAAQKIAYFGIGLSKDRLAIYLDDLVAVTQPCPVCRGTVKRRSNICGHNLAIRIGQVADRRSDTVITGALLRTELLKFLCIEIVRMRIERMEHAVDRRLEYLVIVDLFAHRVVLLDHGQSLGEIALDLLSRYFGAFCVSLS